MQHVSPDVDGGWAFVVFFGYFFTYVLIFGIAYCSSIFYSIFLKEFNQSPLFTAWTVNLNFFCIFCFGEVANVFISAVGPRWTVIIGCILSSMGLFLTSFATNLTTVFVTFGLMFGIGAALPFIVAIEVMSKYFDRYRSALYAVGSSGSGFGQFLYGFALTRLFEFYSWRGGLLIISGINLNLLVIAAIFMSPRDGQKANSLLQIEANECDKRRENPFRSAFHSFVDNLHVLSNRFFILFILSNGLNTLAASAFLTHVVRFALDLGFDIKAAATLTSIMGIASITGRLVTGLICRIFRPRVTGLHVGLTLSMGLSSCICAFMTTYIGLVVTSFVFGFCFATWSVAPEVCVHIVGLKKLSPAMSYTCFASAIGGIAGGPLAAWMYELDPSYLSSFLVSGCLAVLGSFIAVPVWVSIRNGKIAFRIPFDTLSSNELSDLNIKE